MLQDHNGLFLFLPFTLGLIFFVFLASAQAAGGAGWNLTFSDEFNSSSLNTSVWTTTAWGEQCLPANAELEVYEPNAFSESGGVLNILTTNSGVSATNCPGPYTSGLIETVNSFSQLYGYFEMRAKIPSGQGFWPAFWLVPNSGPPPEIDIMEMLNTATTEVHQTFHWVYATGGSATNIYYSPIDCSQNFCTFAADWEPGTVTWYVNGVQTWTYTSSNINSTPAYIIANLAVGGSWPGSPNSSTVFPNKMQIDYIRAYTKVSTGACYATIPTPTDPIPSTTCSSSDTTPPTVAITSPANNATVSSTITVSGTAADNVSVASVQVSVDNGTYASASGTTNWTYSLPTNSLSNGSHSLTAKATDGSGNTTTASINFSVSNAPCDVNKDGVVNVQDVQFEVNEALGITSCTNDLNQDGQCNVIDVQRVVNAALGGACVVGP